MEKKRGEEGRIPKWSGWGSGELERKGGGRRRVKDGGEKGGKRFVQEDGKGKFEDTKQG